jgi:tetratricopeptide (TPR) repeat protein
MKKISLVLIIQLSLFCKLASGQNGSDYSKIDFMLIRNEYNRVIDTCNQILTVDSLNSEIYYKKGLAYQNALPDDKSFDCFLKASLNSPDNKLYKYMVAKGYYGKGKNKKARPLLESLYASDSLNWTYAYYLTSIYMQEKNYDESLRIYWRFYDRDSSDYVILDKIGFALLRKGFYPTAIKCFNRSLALNRSNISSIKNLSFLYASTYRADTALQLLTMGIKIDPTDLDLYIRRAALNFSLNYTKRALDDYLRILATGDSTILYLKRAGIGYSNNLQPEKAIEYLRIAFRKDSSDIEVSGYLARNYQKINDLKNSAYYYRSIIGNLEPVLMQLSFNYVSLAEILKSDNLYNEAITAYLKGQEIRPDVNIYMIVANVYDKNLNDIPKAIHYYQMFLDNAKNTRIRYGTDYIESIRKRVEFLKTPKKASNKTT